MPEPDRIKRALELLQPADRPEVRLIAQAEQSLHLPVNEAAELCRRSMAEAHRRELMGSRLTAHVRLVQALLRAGEGARAAVEAAEVEKALASFVPRMLLIPEAWWAVYGAFQAIGENAAARRAAKAGADWVAVAVTHVPTEFRASFMSPNSLNRALFSTDGRELKAWPAR